MLLLARLTSSDNKRLQLLAELLQLLVLAMQLTKLAREKRKPEELVIGMPEDVLRLQDVMLLT